MIDKFESLPQEKKKRILDACVEEFALNGYDKASTNSIVKKAGISKGLLFHYFGSKKTLFLYVFDYCANYLIEQYYLVKDSEPKDIFERIMWAGILKIKLLHEEPHMYKLVLLAVSNSPESVRQELMERYNTTYAKHMPQFFVDIDTSNFRKEINAQKAIELIMMCVDGISNRYIQKYRNLSVDEVLNNVEKIMEEYKEYMDILKFGIYSQAEEN